MRNLLAMALTAIVLCATLIDVEAQTSGDNKNRWMSVKNNSKRTVRSIYAIPSAKNCCWSRNLLGEELEIGGGGGSLLINFDDGNRTCRFDIHVASERADTFGVGEGWTRENVDVCKPDPPIELKEEVPVELALKVRNESKTRAVVIVAIPSMKRCCWSNDLLGADVLDPMEPTMTLKVMGRPGECHFDIRAFASQVGTTATTWDFPRINLCQDGQKTTEITLRDPPASNDGKTRKMVLKNESALAAGGIYAIPSGKDCCWSSNLLAEMGVTPILKRPTILTRTLKARESREVDLDIGGNACRLDVRVSSTTPGVGWDFDAIDVCNGQERSLTLQE
jgi:hypothetical protein